MAIVCATSPGSSRHNDTKNVLGEANDVRQQQHYRSYDDQTRRRVPPDPVFEPGIRRAPSCGFHLTPDQTKIALRNALRYLPPELHEKAVPEFLEELRTYGRIYAYRWRPAGHIKGRPIDDYEGRCTEGKAFQVQIDNNLDFDVALYPYELVTYGETGSVCQN